MRRGMDEPDEESLVAQARRGDVEAFTRLVERHQEKVYQVVRRLVQNHEDAADLTQEIWMTVYRSLAKFRGQASFPTWVYRIAVNLTLNYLRKQKKEKFRLSLDERRTEGKTIGAGDFLTSPPEDFQLREKLEAAVANLPLAYQSAFILVAYEGMSHRQAAELLGCSENTVAWRMHKARKRLQKQLKPYLSG